MYYEKNLTTKLHLQAGSVYAISLQVWPNFKCKLCTNLRSVHSYMQTVFIFLFFSTVFIMICSWAGYCSILCVTAVVDANSIVETVCQPGLCPSTGYVAEEDGPSCSLIHKEWLHDLWSCRERNNNQYLYSCDLLESSETNLESIVVRNRSNY